MLVLLWHWNPSLWLAEAGGFNPASAHRRVCKGENKKTQRNANASLGYGTQRSVFMICICVSHPHLLCPEAVNNHRPKGPHHPNALFNTPRGLWCVCACINVPQNHLRVCCLALCFHVSMTRHTGFAFACDQVDVWGHTSLCEHLGMRISKCASGVSHSLLAQLGRRGLESRQWQWCSVCFFVFSSVAPKSLFVEKNAGWEMFKAMP